MALQELFFVWCNQGVAFDESIHAVTPPWLIDYEIEGAAGEYVAARVRARVEEDAFDMPAEQWCHLAVRKPDGTIRHMFHGHVDDYPLEIGPERVIELEFLAEPPDALDQEQSLLTQENGAAPFVNDLYTPVDERGTSVALLEGRAALIDFDRRTLAPRLSDILQGRSLFVVEASEHDMEGFSSKQVGLPLKQVTFSISIQWRHSGFAVVDIGSRLAQLFEAAPDGTPTVNTLTGQSFQTGFNSLTLPAGYSQGDRILKQLKIGDRQLAEEDFESSRATVSAVDYPEGANPSGTREAYTTRNWYDLGYTLEADYGQKRREVVYGVVNVALAGAGLAAAVQHVPISLLIPTEAENGSQLPASAPSFFMADGELSDVGRAAIEHALARIAARVRYAGRSVETSFRCAVETVLDIDCDSSVRLINPSLRGGVIEGKVISYRLVMSQSEENAYIVMASSRGDGADAPAGHDVVAEDYRNVDGSTCSSAIVYSDPAIPALVVPVDVDAMLADPAGYLVGQATVNNTGGEQDAGFAAAAKPDEYLIANPTSFTVEMRSLDTQPELLLEIPGLEATITLPRHTGL